MPATRARSSNAPRQAPGVWVSLFAMMMIFIGPLISQSMPMEHHSGMSMSTSMSAAMPASTPAQMHMSMAGSSVEDHSHHAQAVESSGADHVIWAKCGYCTLLFSCPAITQTVAVIAPVPPRPADFFNASAQQGHAQRTVFPNARSRAPPLSSIA